MQRRNPIRYLAIASLAAFCLYAGVHRVVHHGQQEIEELHQQKLAAELHLAKLRIEKALTVDLGIVEAVSTYVAMHPEMDQAAFARYMRDYLGHTEHHLHHAALARDMVISHVYPFAPNQDAIGLDYRTHPAQREEALKAKIVGVTLLAGPLDLVQGGRGIVARHPVYLSNHDRQEFWGLMAAVIDPDQLFGAAELDPTKFALRGVDSKGPMGEHFFGDESIYTHENMSTLVTLPRGSWKLTMRKPASPAASAKLGWMAIVLSVFGGLLAGSLLLDLVDTLRNRPANQ